MLRVLSTLQKSLRPLQSHCSRLHFSTASSGGGGSNNSKNLHKHNTSLVYPQGLDSRLQPFGKDLQYVHGIEVEMHVFPHNQRRMLVGEDLYQLYKKIAPNYVVTIVRKVINDANVITINSTTPNSGTDPSEQPPINNFYQICTYCSIKYLDNYQVLLQGLNKVKIQEIQKIQYEKTNSQEEGAKEDIGTVKVQEGQSNEDGQVGGESNKGLTHGLIKKQPIPTIQSLIRKTQRSYNMQKKPSYHTLKVKKIIQPNPQLTPQLQLKFQYLMQNYMQLYRSHEQHQHSIIFNLKDISYSMDQIASQCANMGTKVEDLQRYMDAMEVMERMEVLLALLRRSLVRTQYFTEIENQAKNVIRRRKFYEYQAEIMKVAKTIKDGKKYKQLFIQNALKSFKSMNPPKQISQTFMQQIKKYTHIDQNSAQAGIVKNYIEQLSKIPYDVKSEEIFDIENAQRIMDEQHYGMKQVKEAILEVIAIGKLKKSLKGKIFCFIGGPGLGKTSFAKSVAKALNRKFYNISLGGVTDSSVLKGHRRTYVGAYSGKIIQALKNCGTNNPVILLDEIDKMGSSYHGDPRSQLLQILDPNQNSSFVDNFVDVPVDLSNVLFITSANYQKLISKPLLDRMQCIYLTSYTMRQKIEIFKRHLLPRAIEKSGIKLEQFQLPDQVIETLVEEYTLGEPGVRYLEKIALKLMEKIVYKIQSKQQEAPVKITKQNLHSYIGNPHFRRKDHNKPVVGVAISLGGGGYQSRLTYIEAFRRTYMNSKEEARGALFTGNLGDVFKQAMNISYTYARNFLLQKFKNRFLYKNEVHVHAPQGAFKKDGSTDSLTIVAALVSLALQTTVKPGVALMGQITLSGHVLRTYEVKQKIMVAKRERITQVILPRQNQSDILNLDQDVKQGIKFNFVKDFQEAFNYLFPEKALQKNQVAAQSSS